MTPPLQPVVEQRGPGGGRAATFVGVVVVLLLLAVLKPWGDGPSEGSGGAPPDAVRPGGPSDAPSVTESPVPTPSRDPIAAACLNPDGWRLATIESFGGSIIRRWQTITPVEATRPDDPDIPVGLAASDAVLAIGWCAPITGPDRPLAIANVTVWRLDRVGREAPVPQSVGGRRGIPLSPLGAIYDPPTYGAIRDPDGAEAAAWPPGRYVFRVVHGEQARWLAVDVFDLGDSRPAPSGPSASQGSG